MKINLELKKYRQEGDMAHEYNPLRNILDENNQIVDFDTDELNIDLNHPLNLECQPSYDGTVNLIINDDKNPPRIVNTRFSKIEDDRYKIINRNQREQTNLYKVGKIDQQTRLFRNINSIPKIDLINVTNVGQLMGGNYTFYIKFADNDYNKTDIVAESGVVSIFKGYSNRINTISGTIFNERTDKAIKLRISNVDTSFSKIYVYYIRETCDQNGFRITKAGMYQYPYEIRDNIVDIVINGFEDEEELTPEEINIQYNIVTAAKTQAQVQNMLFFGNVQSNIVDVKNLQNISYFIPVSLRQKDSIGWISAKDYSQKSNDDIDQTEYYSTNNIYYNLGYWPDEIYRLGVVYILNDDSLTPVFNLRGHNFNQVSVGDSNVEWNFNRGEEHLFSLVEDEFDQPKKVMNYLERDEFLTTKKFLDNTFGVFKTPDATIINYEQTSVNNAQSVNPLYFNIVITDEIKNALKEYNVKGLFFVRQKRIPTNLGQGFSIGIDRVSNTPIIWDSSRNGGNGAYVAESFLTSDNVLSTNFESHLVETQNTQCSGLLCVDAMVNTQLQANFDGSEFILKPQFQVRNNAIARNNRHYYLTDSAVASGVPQTSQVQSTLVYVDSETPMKYVNGFGYSTKCGMAEDVSKFSFFSETNKKDATNKLLRGVYCPFLGTNQNLNKNTVYTIKVPNYSGALIKDYFSIRGKDTSPFYAISDRYSIDESFEVDCFRGDCYSNTVTVRINRNFVDSEVPVTDIIIDPDTWKNNYKGYLNMINNVDAEDIDKDKVGNFTNINRADVNAVPLGIWLTYKCLSNYNLGLRTIDTSNSSEYALMGSPRGFYPVMDMSVASAQKIEESKLLNDGYNSTVGQRRNFIVDNVPYIKELYDNRVMFSNVQREDDFQNAYRIFQGLSFKDIDRQYGAIVKLIAYGVNLFCVFEHGLGIIPINEKALLSTTTGQSIHMYGAGVIQNQITLISPDFGSIWPESVIRTPIGIYGVDTYAKKIWRYSDKGLETISDMKIQRFLNDNIKLFEKDKYPIIALKNVKSHYNNYKGDVMFTFYNELKDTTWNLCYNERMDKWITRYSWTPLYSENINNIFYSLDQDRAKILSYIYNNQNCTYGLRVGDEENQWTITDANSDYVAHLNTIGYELMTNYEYTIDSFETAYLNENDEQVDLKITNVGNIFNVITTEDQETYVRTTTLTIDYSNLLEALQTYTKPTPASEPNLNHVPAFLKVNLTIRMWLDHNTSSEIHDVLGIVIDNKILENSNLALYSKEKKAFLQNGFYVHGKAGLFNQIDYRDASFENEILPTKWYERQEPFEFEFVVNDQVGLHKIFDNLVIISNNVQPNQIEYEIIGDVYKFNKTGLFRSQNFENENEWDIRYNKPKFMIANEKRADNKSIDSVKYQSSQDFDNCRVVWDDVLNQYSLITTQDCKNIEQWGRRLGNIHYKEDSWYITIEPIKYREKYRINDGSVDDWSGEKEKYSKTKEVRIRDKFVKIRVKYTGEDMVIITALRTILTPSYS